MGSLTPRDNEIKLQRKFFEERVNLVGIPGKLYRIKNYDRTSHRATFEKADFELPIDIHFIFNDMPTIKTLKSLNWFSEDDENLPIIAELPWFVGNDLLEPQIGSKLEIEDPISKYKRVFEISEVKADSYYLINYIVKLTPFYEKNIDVGVPTDPNIQGDSSYAFLNK